MEENLEKDPTLVDDVMQPTPDAEAKEDPKSEAKEDPKPVDDSKAVDDPKVVDEAKEDPEPEETPKADPKGEENVEGDPKADPKDDVKEDLNPLAKAFSQLGLNFNKVRIGEETKSIKDLTESEQLSVLQQELLHRDKYYNDAIKEIKNLGPEFEDPVEKDIIGFLRDGGSPLELGEALLKATPPKISATATDEEILLADALRKHPALNTEKGREELKSHIDTMPDGIKKIEVESVRKALEKTGGQFAGFSESAKEYIKAQRLEAEKQERLDMDVLNNELTSTNDLFGIPLKSEVKEYLKQQVSVIDPKSGQIPFIKELHNPKVLLQTAFMHTYLPQIIDAAKKQGFKDGVEKTAKGTKIYEVTSVGQKKTKPEPIKKVRTPEDIIKELQNGLPILKDAE